MLASHFLEHLDTLLRSLVLGQLGLYGEESVVAEAKKRLAAHVANTTTLPADLRSPVYKTVVSQADEKTYDQMLKVNSLYIFKSIHSWLRRNTSEI